ncbi:MAG: glycoside hydrolase family 2 protein [Burkholderiales bacterium]|nr:glycoside hydrolase family 2 protein [Burkholderiales bacterium]
MHGRGRPSDGSAGRALDTGWSFRSTAAGACAQPSAVDAMPGTWSAATVPCTVAAARRALGDWSLASPPERFDALDWWFRIRIERSPVTDGQHEVLCLDGLATLADVWIDGVHVLASDNMFVVHRVRLPAQAAPECELVLRFRSLDAALAAVRERPRWRAPMVENQKLRRVRTTLLGRTPGWSPPAAPVGPWRPVRLETASDGQPMPGFAVDASLVGDAGHVRVHGRLDAPGPLELVVEVGEQVWRAPLVRDADGTLAGALVVPAARRWWPNGYGEPVLHRVSVQAAAGLGRPTGLPVALGTVGFRTIEIDRADEGFRVVVNGVPVFCRGACWMPLDPVALSAPAEAYRAAVGQAREAGFTMLRVCGPTVYEDEALYDACDAAGLLVWQDLMFANLDYPGDDPAFLASVEREVREQLARLRGRPCVAVVCGNSEVSQQAAMLGAPREAWSPPLFGTVLQALAAECVPGVPYWPSSAWGGAFPHQAGRGTTSFYGVGAYLRPLDDASVADVRFATECLGFANVPEPVALERMPGGAGLRVHHPGWAARTPRDLGAGWDFDDVRDAYLASVFGVDPVTLRREDHDRYLELGRIVTGEAMRSTFVRWRTGGARCGGGLVWTLRDLWAGAGWGLLDELGEPKAAWHLLRAALRPRAVAVTDHGGDGLRLHVFNDGPEPLTATLELERVRDGERLGAPASRGIEVAPHGSAALDAVAMLDGFEDLNHAYRFGPRAIEAVVATLRAADGTPIDRVVHLCEPRLGAPERDVGMSVEVAPLADGRPGLRIRTQRLARWVAVRIAQHVPDDSHFHLPPGGEIHVGLRPRFAGAPLRGTVQAANAERRVRIDA